MPVQHNPHHGHDFALKRTNVRMVNPELFGERGDVHVCTKCLRLWESRTGEQPSMVAGTCPGKPSRPPFLKE